MLSTDRDEFKIQLAKLCAGFNVPMTEAREDAYFTGLEKMSLIQFARCVDHALGQEGVDKFPSTNVIWTLHKMLRNKANAPRTVNVIEEKDHLLYFANRLLFTHLMNRGGLGSTGTFKAPTGVVGCEASEELNDARVAMHRLVAWFMEPIEEGDEMATPRQFITQYIASVGKVSPIAPATLAKWRKMLADSRDCDLPFEPHMGRELKFKTESRQLVPA